MHLFIKQKQTHRTTLWLSEGKAAGEGQTGEFGIDIYTAYLKQVTNKGLLCNTGNRCSVIT